jgi:hypothetical protein
MFESPVALLSYIRSPAPSAGIALMNRKPLIFVMLVGVLAALAAAAPACAAVSEPAP